MDTRADKRGKKERGAVWGEGPPLAIIQCGGEKTRRAGHLWCLSVICIDEGGGNSSAALRLYKNPTLLLSHALAGLRCQLRWFLFALHRFCFIFDRALLFKSFEAACCENVPVPFLFLLDSISFLRQSVHCRAAVF